VRQYLLLMGLSALLCWVAWLFVLFSMNPNTGVIPAVLLFYLTLFFAACATFSIVGFWLRRRLRPEDLLLKQVVVSFRQSLFLSFLIVGALILERRGTFTWTRFYLLAITVSVIEFLVLAFTSHRRTRKRLLRAIP